MDKILKWKLSTKRHQLVDLPIGAEPLQVLFQDGVACLWARCDVAQRISEEIWIDVYQEGDQLVGCKQYYLNTIQNENGTWHIFWRPAW